MGPFITTANDIMGLIIYFSIGSPPTSWRNREGIIARLLWMWYEAPWEARTGGHGVP